MGTGEQYKYQEGQFEEECWEGQGVLRAVGKDSVYDCAQWKRRLGELHSEHRRSQSLRGSLCLRRGGSWKMKEIQNEFPGLFLLQPSRIPFKSWGGIVSTQGIRAALDWQW